MSCLNLILLFGIMISVAQGLPMSKKKEIKIAAENIQKNVFDQEMYFKSFSSLAKDDQYAAMAPSISSRGYYQPKDASTPKLEACPDVKCHVSLSLVFDSSGSVGKANFDSQLEFAETFVEILGRKALEFNLTVCTGIVVYSTDVEVPVNPCCGNHICAVSKIIKNMRYHGSSTNTAGALKVARQMLQGTSNYNKHVMLITDGKSNHGGNPVPIANNIRRDGARIIVIAVGDNVDETEIKNIMDSDEYAHIDSFDSFDDLAVELIEKNKESSVSKSFSEMCEATDYDDFKSCTKETCKWDSNWSQCEADGSGLCYQYKNCVSSGDVVDQQQRRCYSCREEMVYPIHNFPPQPPSFQTKKRPIYNKGSYRYNNKGAGVFYQPRY